MFSSGLIFERIPYQCYSLESWNQDFR